jgi:glycosyltransferase involved in cell wall biosynthesis
MKINVLICSIDEGIDNVRRIIQPVQKDVNYIVSHQFLDEKFKLIPEELKREDIILSQIPGKGLSRNRNNAISWADGDIALIADDDVQYLPGTFEIIREAFENDKEMAVACFKIKTPDDEPEYKKYPGKSYSLGNYRHHPVSSVEIAFKTSPVIKAGIRFDERFGLGSEKLIGGEETVFISDCIKAGIKVRYLPYYIVKHPYESTRTKYKRFDPEINQLNGAVCARVYGRWAFPHAFAKTLLLFPLMLCAGKNPAIYLKLKLSAIQYILNHKS